MAGAMLQGNTQPNFAVKEDSVTLIGKAITASDYASKKERAIAAYQQKDSNDVCNAEVLKQESIVTNCAIFNATGDPIQLVCTKEWNGQVQNSYPTEIGNGQWALFVHTMRAMVPEGSKAAVVCRIKNADAQECDWMSAWDNPRKKFPCIERSTTHVYTEIGEVNHFTDKWSIINEKLKAAGHKSSDTQYGCIAEVTITEGSPAHFDAVITLEN